jgi:hypothetical protein
MTEISLVSIAPNDFNGMLCRTGTDCQLSVAVHALDFPSKETLLYYVQSIPFTSYPQKTAFAGGIVPSDTYLVREFQKACNKWTEYTGIKFERTYDKEASDFRIRMANTNEEEEKKNLVADAFFWSYPENDLKILRIWKQIGDWDVYSVFLHEVGHILGFRHEHAFLSADERILIGSSESSAGSMLLQGDLVDKTSIMSYGYLRKFKENCGNASLSVTDQDQCRKLYDRLRKEGRFGSKEYMDVIGMFSFLVEIF